MKFKAGRQFSVWLLGENYSKRLKVSPGIHQRIVTYDVAATATEVTLIWSGNVFVQSVNEEPQSIFLTKYRNMVSPTSLCSWAGNWRTIHWKGSFSQPVQNYCTSQLEEEGHLYWARQKQAQKLQASSLAALTPCISHKNFRLTMVSASFSGFNSQKKITTSSNDTVNNLRLFK